MEYTTLQGEPCTREQYIRTGLERGEVLVQEACGCVVIQDRTADAYIVYCHTHDAAPEMYEALKAIIEEKALTKSDPLRTLVIQAIAKAEGGSQ